MWRGPTENEGERPERGVRPSDAARIELCGKAPFVSSEAFGLVDFLGADCGDLPTFPTVRRRS